MARQTSRPYRTVTDEEVIAAIRAAKGLQALAAHKLGCHVTTIWRHAVANEEVRLEIQHQREKMLDSAEHKLFEAISRGDPWAVCFFLKTQGKGRNYSERIQFSGPENGAIQVNHSVKFDWSKVTDADLEDIVRTAEKYLSTL